MAQPARPRIAVIGAGPVRLEAALEATQLGYPVTVYERGDVGEALGQWGHVRLFTPFGMNASPLGLEVIRKEHPQHQVPRAERPDLRPRIPRRLPHPPDADSQACRHRENTNASSLGRPVGNHPLRSAQRSATCRRTVPAATARRTRGPSVLRRPMSFSIAPEPTAGTAGLGTAASQRSARSRPRSRSPTLWKMCSASGSRSTPARASSSWAAAIPRQLLCVPWLNSLKTARLPGSSG